MLNLKLNIFELTEEQEDADKAGVEISLEDCDIIEQTFHIIEYTKPIGQYCLISSGGSIFTVTESYESVNNKINERLSFKIN